MQAWGLRRFYIMTFTLINSVVSVLKNETRGDSGGCGFWILWTTALRWHLQVGPILAAGLLSLVSSPFPRVDRADSLLMGMRGLCSEACLDSMVRKHSWQTWAFSPFIWVGTEMAK